jgi:nitroreductase
MTNALSVNSLEPASRAVAEQEARLAEAAIHDQFIKRWSSRAFAEERLDQATIDSLFEAARWAPSAANNQPWLFIYADSEPDLVLFRSLINDKNRRWADRAPLLAFVLARKHQQGKPIRSAAFDTGAAWMSLALQAHQLGLTARAMGGIHREQVYPALGIPSEDYEVMCGLAIGRIGDGAFLPPDLAERERPNSRRPLAEVAVRGGFRAANSSADATPSKAGE